MLMFTSWCTIYLLTLHNDFGKREVTSRFNLGTRSNLPKLKKTLIEREFIEETESGLFLSDPLFAVWFKINMM